MPMITAEVRLTIDGKRYTAHIYPGDDHDTMHVYDDRGDCALTTFAPNMTGYAESLERVIREELNR